MRAVRLVFAMLFMLFLVVGCIILGSFFLHGFASCLVIMYEAAGFVGVVAMFFIFPVVWVAAPWYAALAWGDWFPLLFCYGTLIIGWIGHFVMDGIGGVFTWLNGRGA